MTNYDTEELANLLVFQGVDRLREVTAEVEPHRKAHLFEGVGAIAVWNPFARQEDVNPVLRAANQHRYIGNEVVAAGKHFAGSNDIDSARWRYRSGARIVGRATKQEAPNPLLAEGWYEDIVQDPVRIVSLQYEIDDLVGARQTLRGVLPYIFALSGPRREATLPEVHDTLLLEMAEVSGYNSRIGNRLLGGLQLSSSKNQANLQIRSAELDREFAAGNHWRRSIHDLARNPELLVPTNMWRIVSTQLESSDFSVRSRAENILRAALKADLHLAQDKEAWDFIGGDIVDALAIAGHAEELVAVIEKYGTGPFFKSAAVILGRRGDSQTKNRILGSIVWSRSFASDFSKYFRYGLEQVPRDVR